MYKIETKHHIIQTNNNDKPAFTCVGPCESVWWKNDIPPYSPLKYYIAVSVVVFFVLQRQKITKSLNL